MHGGKVIGVTSVAYASETGSRHASGTYLKDHCDIVLDSKIAVGDADAHPRRHPRPLRPRLDRRDHGPAPGGDGDGRRRPLGPRRRTAAATVRERRRGPRLERPGHAGVRRPDFYRQG
ncbi:hypothetical protein E4K10_19150 [Streptomyces sp. T1317-0309]|nr:hypothetical protein E4K10_19150 [Streptomyces sp. T1317-0309]